MSFLSTLSPAGPRMIGGLTRRSLISAVTAMSTTSSPKRRPFGQPPGTVAAAESRLHLARQHVAAEDAQAREAGVVRIGRMPSARRRRGVPASVDRSTLIRSGMKMPAMSVRFVSGATVRVEDKRVDQRRELRVLAYLRNSSLSRVGLGPAVQVLVRDRDEAFVEERIALTRDLHESARRRSARGSA